MPEKRTLVGATVTIAIAAMLQLIFWIKDATSAQGSSVKDATSLPGSFNAGGEKL